MENGPFEDVWILLKVGIFHCISIAMLVYQRVVSQIFVKNFTLKLGKDATNLPCTYSKLSGRLNQLQKRVREKGDSLINGVFNFYHSEENTIFTQKFLWKLLGCPRKLVNG